MSPRIGGVYTKSYDSTLLTTSSLLTAYSDYTDGKEDRPRFWSVQRFTLGALTPNTTAPPFTDTHVPSNR